MNTTSLAAAAAVLALAGAAHAAARTPLDVVHHHMEAAGKGDIDAVASDYADDAVTLTARGATVGKAAIRASFAKMMAPAKPGGASGMSGMHVEKVWQDGDVGMVSWSRGPMHGMDAFVVKNGKIQSQSVFLSGGPPAGGPPAK